MDTYTMEQMTQSLIETGTEEQKNDWYNRLKACMELMDIAYCMEWQKAVDESGK